MSKLDPFFISYGTGSITGFDQFLKSDGSSDLILTGWSIDQLMAYLKNPDNIPPRDWIIAVENDLEEHLNDTNNPHQTTVDQVATSFVEQILGALVPGTVPDVSPFYSFKADLELPMGDLFPSTVSSTNVYRLKNNGIYTLTTSDSDYIGTDYVSGKAGIPLYKSFTNLVPIGWNENAGTIQNTFLTVNSLPQDFTPGVFYRVSETNTTGVFGININAPLQDATSYTMSVFVKTAGIEGTLKINQIDDPSKFALVSLDTGECVASDSSVQVFTNVYRNNVIRISFSFTTLEDSAGSVSMTFYEKNGTITNRVGVYGRDIFNVSYPLICNTPPRFPIPGAITVPTISEKFLLSLDRIITSEIISRFTVNMEIIVDPLTVPTLGTNVYVLVMDPFRITRTATSFQIRVNNTVIYTVPIVSGINRFSVSYTNDEIVLKFMDNDSISITGVFPSVIVDNWYCGPFGGYLLGMEIYATSENNDLLGFLNNA